MEWPHDSLAREENHANSHKKNLLFGNFMPLSVRSILIAHGNGSKQEKPNAMLNDKKDIQKRVINTSSSLVAYKCPSSCFRKRHIRLCKYKHSGDGEMWPLWPLHRNIACFRDERRPQFSVITLKRGPSSEFEGNKGTQGWFSPSAVQAQIAAG